MQILLTGWVHGSFANSLHLKGFSAEEVADAIGTVMGGFGLEAVSDEREKKDQPIREFFIGEETDGWVGILDSEWTESHVVGAALSKQLQAPSIVLFVNDSDSWHFQLFDKGSLVDEFDSSGGAGAADGVGFTADSNDFEECQRNSALKMNELRLVMALEYPEEIRETLEKMVLGTATQEEWDQHRELRDSVQEYRRELGKVTGNFFAKLQEPASSSPAQVPAGDMDSHAEALRVIVSDAVKKGDLLKALSQSVGFAESSLADFFKLIGIRPHFAYLGGQYVNESTESELAEEGIRFVTRRKYGKSTN